MSEPRKPTAAMMRRHRLLAQWRGVPAGPLIDYPAKKLGSVLEKVVKQLGLTGRIRLEEVQAVWKEAAGAFIAKQTQPDGWLRGVLTVRVTNSSAMHAVHAIKAELLAKVQARLGADKIKDIKFRHG